MNRPSFEELKVAAQPLVDILYKYYDPHTTIMVEQGQVKVLRDDMGMPLEIKN